jgi:hypothetical protein
MKNLLFLLPFLFVACLSDARLAQKCADKFPAVITTVRDTTVIDSIRFLTLDVSALPVMRSVVCPASAEPSVILVSCPPCVREVEYRTRYVKEMVLDSANVFLLKDKLLKEVEKREAIEKLNKKLKIDSDKYSTLRKIGNKIIIILGLLLALGIVSSRFIKKKVPV